MPRKSKKTPNLKAGIMIPSKKAAKRIGKLMAKTKAAKPAHDRPRLTAKAKVAKQRRTNARDRRALAARARTARAAAQAPEPIVADFKATLFVDMLLVTDYFLDAFPPEAKPTLPVPPLGSHVKAWMEQGWRVSRATCGGLIVVTKDEEWVPPVKPETLPAFDFAAAIGEIRQAQGKRGRPSRHLMDLIAQCEVVLAAGNPTDRALVLAELGPSHAETVFPGLLTKAPVALVKPVLVAPPAHTDPAPAPAPTVPAERRNCCTGDTCPMPTPAELAGLPVVADPEPL